MCLCVHSRVCVCISLRYITLPTYHNLSSHQIFVKMPTNHKFVIWHIRYLLLICFSASKTVLRYRLNKLNCGIFFWILHLYMNNFTSKIIKWKVSSDLNLLLCPESMLSFSVSVTDIAFAHLSLTAIWNCSQNGFILLRLVYLVSIWTDRHKINRLVWFFGGLKICKQARTFTNFQYLDSRLFLCVWIWLKNPAQNAASCPEPLVWNELNSSGEHFWPLQDFASSVHSFITLSKQDSVCFLYMKCHNLVRRVSKTKVWERWPRDIQRGRSERDELTHGVMCT